MKCFERLNGGFEELFIMDKATYFSQSLYRGIADLFKLNTFRIFKWKQTSWQSNLGFGKR